MVTIHITKSSRERGERLAAILDGETYMNLKVLLCPYRGEIHVNVEGNAETEEELRAMVMSVMAAELTALSPKSILDR